MIPEISVELNKEKHFLSGSVQFNEGVVSTDIPDTGNEFAQTQSQALVSSCTALRNTHRYLTWGAKRLSLND